MREGMDHVGSVTITAYNARRLMFVIAVCKATFWREISADNALCSAGSALMLLLVSDAS